MARVASKENLWGQKLTRRLAKVRQQLNITMQHYKEELLSDSYEEVSRHIAKLHDCNPGK